MDAANLVAFLKAISKPELLVLELMAKFGWENVKDTILKLLSRMSAKLRLTLTID